MLKGCGSTSTRTSAATPMTRARWRCCWVGPTSSSRGSPRSRPRRRRAGLRAYGLELAGRADMPVAAGAAGVADFTLPLTVRTSITGRSRSRRDRRRPAPHSRRSSRHRARRHDRRHRPVHEPRDASSRPGRACWRRRRVVVMGGHRAAAAGGLPAWGPGDRHERPVGRLRVGHRPRTGDPTLVPLFACARVTLRAWPLERSARPGRSANSSRTRPRRWGATTG